MTNINDTGVEQAIFPESDYRDNEPQLEPPVQWIDAVPVRVVAADGVNTYTVAVPSLTDVSLPMMVVPQCGNNERKRVLLVAATNNIFLTDEPNQMVLPAVAGIVAPPTTFRLSTGVVIVYESAAALYACSAGAGGTFGFLSVLIETYKQSYRES